MKTSFELQVSLIPDAKVGDTTEDDPFRVEDLGDLLVGSVAFVLFGLGGYMALLDGSCFWRQRKLGVSLGCC